MRLAGGVGLMSITLRNFDGMTDAQVEGTLDPTLPLVILLHGLSGKSLDMTAPLVARPGIAFIRAGLPVLYTDRGIHWSPPPLPAGGFFLDPPALSVTSWQQALNAAGFSTVTYSMAGPLIADDAMQLAALAKGPLMAHPQLSGLRIAIVAHSRGGLVARAFLRAATADPMLAPLLARMTSLVCLHSPHLGSGVASLGAGIDALLARIQGALTTATGSAPGFLAMLRGMVLNPSTAELVIGSPTALVAPSEPVPGVSYHTFGGSSTAFARLWANVFTPDSYVPWPLPFVPFPLFHWGSTPALAGIPLDAASFIPLAGLLAPIPEVATLTTALATLVATTPELAPGVGDVLVTDARARLPFSISHTTNALNHAEALWDPTLQAQVVAILSLLRTGGSALTPSRQAIARISPFPTRSTPTAYTVTAKDQVTGVPITSGTVTVRDTGGVALQGNIGVPFTFAFRGKRIHAGHATGRDRTRDGDPVEMVFPTVDAELPAPYGRVPVDTGH
jgi:hypothetical protein